MDFRLKNLKSFSFHLTTAALFAGLLLTFISWLKLCTESCSEAHNYRIFGLRFEFLGGFYFVLLGVLHLLSKEKSSLNFLVTLLVALGLGAEIFFIWIQKSEIGSWCPVCLSIAASLAIAATGCFLRIFNEENFNKGGIMKSFSALFTVFLGFLIAFGSVTKIDKLEAAENELKDKMKFGNVNSPIEVYIFTDWACPACRALEPKLEALAGKVMRKAAVTFVDVVVHPETLNYAPYNIAFMIQNKPQYFKARNALTKLSLDTKKPTEKQVTKAVAPYGIKFQELGYGDISLGMKYFDQLSDKYKVDATPTLVIINRDAKKGKKLSGLDEITESNTLKAIDALR